MLTGPTRCRVARSFANIAEARWILVLGAQSKSPPFTLVVP